MKLVITILLFCSTSLAVSAQETSAKRVTASKTISEKFEPTESSTKEENTINILSAGKKIEERKIAKENIEELNVPQPHESSSRRKVDAIEH